MIILKNSQRAIPIDKQQVVSEVQTILDIIKYSNFDIGILITTNKTIRSYNKQYRQQDKPTDILSFPFYPELQAGKRIKVLSEEEKNLGDLIVSAAYVQKDAQKYGITFEERLRVLLVHGICHLLGYDHIDDADFRRMRAKEAFILKKLNQK
jgi:rRNA maturation RNase YbeY